MVIRRFGFCLLFSSLVGVAQTSTSDLPTLTFDVISIHVSAPPSGGFIRVGGPNPPHSSSYETTNMNALGLVANAYGVSSSRVSGAPEWARTTNFDIKAKSDAATDDILAKLTNQDGTLEKRRMLLTLLNDRFHLKAHLVMLPATVYSLVTEKDGAHLQETKPGPPAVEHPTQICNASGCEFMLDNTTMSSFARTLGLQLNTTVDDRTGLTGNYNLHLKYRGILAEDANEDPNAPPPLINAIQDQLGLKVVPAKGQVQGVVIDSIEKPSEN